MYKNTIRSIILPLMLSTLYGTNNVQYTVDQMVNIIPVALSGSPIVFETPFHMEVEGRTFMEQTPEEQARQVNAALGLYNRTRVQIVEMPVNGSIVTYPDYVQVGCIVCAAPLEYRGEQDECRDGYLARFYLTAGIPHELCIGVRTQVFWDLECSRYTVSELIRLLPRVALQMPDGGIKMRETGWYGWIGGFDAELAEAMGVGLPEAGLIYGDLVLHRSFYCEISEYAPNEGVIQINHVLDDFIVGGLKLLIEGDIYAAGRLSEIRTVPMSSDLKVIGLRLGPIGFYLDQSQNPLHPQYIQDLGCRLGLHILEGFRARMTPVETYRSLRLKESWVNMFRYTAFSPRFEGGYVVELDD